MSPARLIAALDFPMSSVEELVENSGLLLDLYGHWPSFHDAEVLEMSLNRGAGAIEQSLTAQIHLFEMTRMVAPDGRFLCRKHVIATFQFSGVVDVLLKDFNHQNVIEGLSICLSDEGEELREGLSVVFEGCHGVECSFRCMSICLLSVESGIPRGSIYAKGGKI